jgi:hypothetical protein
MATHDRDNKFSGTNLVFRPHLSTVVFILRLKHILRHNPVSQAPSLTVHELPFFFNLTLAVPLPPAETLAFSN